SLSAWRTLWRPFDRPPRDQWKLAPVWKLRARGFFGEKKSSPTLISRGAALAAAGSASSPAVATATRNLRTPVNFLASSCPLQLRRSYGPKYDPVGLEVQNWE